MLTRGIGILAAALAAAGCYGRAPAPAPAPPPAAPVIEDVGWPTRLEFRTVERTFVLKHRGLAMFSVETSLPVFRSDPPGVAAALNARIARLGRPDVDPSTHQGEYSIDCTVELANRYAVLIDCEQLLDERTHEEAEDGAGGASAEPRQLTLGWWLRRGLPELSTEQLAPELDLEAAIDAASASQLPACDLRACAFDPRSFLLDGEGLTLVATEACAGACDVSIPTVPLDQLAPTHAWAAQLVARVRRRVDAGDEIVEGDRTP